MTATPGILDTAPEEVLVELGALRAALDEAIPPKHLDYNLLIGTWNIRAFGGLTETWKSGKADSPKRDLHALCCITEIVSRFDVIAVQEVKGNIKALRRMLRALGSDWGFIMTDVTLGSPGNDERMAFVFDTRRVKPSGLAGELVVPEEWMAAGGVKKDALTRQFARTPFAVSFLSAGQTFILVTLHVLYGEQAEDRRAELKGIAEWLADWAKREGAWGHNLIALGDFNIDRRGDDNYDAFTSTGLRSPKELAGVPRTIFKGGKDKYYDQVAWFAGAGDVPMLSLTYGGRAGFFDFTKVVLRSLPKRELSWRISDHYPLWTEFLVRRY